MQEKVHAVGPILTFSRTGTYTHARLSQLVFARQTESLTVLVVKAMKTITAEAAKLMATRYPSTGR